MKITAVWLCLQRFFEHLAFQRNAPLTVAKVFIDARVWRLWFGYLLEKAENNELSAFAATGKPFARPERRLMPGAMPGVVDLVDAAGRNEFARNVKHVMRSHRTSEVSTACSRRPWPVHGAVMGDNRTSRPATIRIPAPQGQNNDN